MHEHALHGPWLQHRPPGCAGLHQPSGVLLLHGVASARPAAFGSLLHPVQHEIEHARSLTKLKALQSIAYHTSAIITILFLFLFFITITTLALVQLVQVVAT